MDKNMRATKIFALALTVFIITLSIAIPIFIRPFYYAHIGPLDLCEKTGMSYEQIKEAYNEVLDYLTTPGKKFGTGDFPYSEIGYDHFKDCKVLFFISNSLLLISLTTIITISVMVKRGKIELERKNKRHISYTVAKRMLIICGISLPIIAVGFESVFTLFHKILFPAKDNWVLQHKTDPFVLALPEEFFLSCAILIFASIVVQSIGLIVFNLKSEKSPR